MVDRLIAALVESENEAADALLVDALRLGNESEQTRVLDALVQRQKVRGLSGVIAQYDSLPQSLQIGVLRQIKAFHSALRECGRSDAEQSNTPKPQAT